LCIELIYILDMKTDRKQEVVMLRLSTDEKVGFREASDLAGIGLSTWIRERLRRTAIRELEEAGRVAPFIRQRG
jgi:hypothetical protein